LIYVAKATYVACSGGSRVDTDLSELPSAKEFLRLLRRLDPTYVPPKGMEY